MADTSQWFMILRTLGSLIAVLALIYGLSWAAKRYVKPELFAGAAAKVIRILHSMPIENKKRLIVVEIGNKQILLGVSEASISFLCDVQPQSSLSSGVSGTSEESRYVASNR